MLKKTCEAVTGSKKITTEISEFTEVCAWDPDDVLRQANDPSFHSDFQLCALCVLCGNPEN